MVFCLLLSLLSTVFIPGFSEVTLVDVDKSFSGITRPVGTHLKILTLIMC